MIVALEGMSWRPYLCHHYSKKLLDVKFFSLILVPILTYDVKEQPWVKYFFNSMHFIEEKFNEIVACNFLSIFSWGTSHNVHVCDHICLPFGKQM